jgi:hypothetical protein
MKKLLIVLVLLLVACKPRITSGKVIDKQYSPEHSETELMYNPALKLYLPQTNYYDEEFIITIQGKDTDGHYDTRSFYVNERQYRRVKVGQYVTFDN